ncbi:unnamed protein product [Cylindrotheca closterium]|uniref:Uncharacterized protein n=1 Tax=Cylindrotheca closterium TaxID=2856 RepID=A0AAD2G7M4_9STRA|nr:unnamed protein product [Cylindrotheca closterium]
MINEEIVDLNNRTVALLQEQDFIEAIENSSMVLRRHREIYQTSSRQASSSGDDSLDKCMLRSGTDENRYYADNTFIYDHGIVIPTSANGVSSMVAAILIFNCALSHQLRAQQVSRGRSRHHLSSAKRLYELAHGVCNEDPNFLFHFVVINNIAVIDRRLGQNEISAQRFQQLLAVLMLLIDQGNTKRVRHVQGFLANVITTTDTAPAA